MPVIPRSSSVFLMCFSLILLPFSLLLPVFNLWQLLRSHSRDFLDQKHLHACLKQMREENSDILQRAPEPCWTRIEGADCNWLYDTAVGVRQMGPCGQARPEELLLQHAGNGSARWTCNTALKSYAESLQPFVTAYASGEITITALCQEEDVNCFRFLFTHL